MAGPQVRGDLKVSRNVQSRKVRQGVRVFKATPATSIVTLTSGDPYTLSLEPTPTTTPPTTATAPVVTLPSVSAASVITTGASADDRISTPTGPASGIGTEFRIHNTSNFDAIIRDSGDNSLLVGGLPSGNTAIAYCTDATTSVGVWNVYVVDAAASQLTPRNVPFTNAEGTKASGSVSITGTSSVAGVVNLTFTSTNGNQDISTQSLISGTTAVQAAAALITSLTNNATFSEFYTATAQGSNAVTIGALDNGTNFNAPALDITVPTGLTGVDGTLTGGTGGSWTEDPNNSSESFFSIPRVRHQRGLDPIFSVYENVSASDRSEVLIESTVNPSTGEIRIIVNRTPLGIFAGSVDIL